MGSIVSRHSIAAMFAVTLFATAPTDLKVVDSGGTETVVIGATIDYGGFMTDVETEGIRVMQGEGVVFLHWANIDTLKILKTELAAKPPRVDVEVVLRSGRRHPVTLLQKGRMRLTGKTDLGDYAIDLSKVRAIIPVR